MHFRLFCHPGSPLRCEVYVAKNADQQVGTDAKNPFPGAPAVLSSCHLSNRLPEQIKTHLNKHLLINT